MGEVPDDIRKAVIDVTLRREPPKKEKVPENISPISVVPAEQEAQHTNTLRGLLEQTVEKQIDVMGDVDENKEVRDRVIQNSQVNLTQDMLRRYMK